MVKAGVKSIAAIPLMVKGRLLAVLYLYSLQPNAFQDPSPLLTVFIHQAAIALENARLFAQAQRRAEELTVLNQAGQAMTSSLDLEQVLLTSLRQATQVLQTEAASILLLDEEKNELEFMAAIGANADALKGRRLP